MRRLLALLFAVFALSLGACNMPSEGPTGKPQPPASLEPVF
jgi:hypothetical protein